ncbi:MAG: thioredoxin-disulfide reductase [Bacteroides sp.]|nr:thioredoxin-disulfide reductase [Prevotella sp.]MCM1406961.1 thioredoxin-disulfide reductase [Treponema brennaborense]MCM1470112.1 thioredoxin-disulfide reductase [Bacteroides sp.]
MRDTEYDFISIGGGVAGLAAAQYGARANLKTLVIESGMYGGQALNISALENYPGIFPPAQGNSYIENMKKQAEAFGARCIQAAVLSVDKTGGMFSIKTSDETLHAYAVLIATGAARRKLNVPGEDMFSGRGVSYCAACDGPFFRNKKIAVIGGGDSACDEAEYLSTISPSVTVIHRRGTFRAQKSLAERVMKNPRISVLFDTIVTEIRGTDKVHSLIIQNTISGTEQELPADGVFIFAGMEPRTALFETIAKDQNGYIITNERMETNIPGLYCAGDVRSKPFRQLITAAADGATAAHCAGEYIYSLRSRIHS